MTDWPRELLHIVHSARDVFGISDIRNPHGLDSVRQTGFVWTQQAGVICLAMNRAYLSMARDNPAITAIITPPTTIKQENEDDRAVIISTQAEELYCHLHALQQVDHSEDAVHIDASAVIDDSAVLRGSVRIEAGVQIGPRVVISGPVVIRRDTRIDAGAIIGCEGLYAKVVQGAKQHIPHFGGIDIGEDAFIHAGAVIVRSAIKGEATRIGNRVHIGVMSNIGHDVIVGEAATISSNSVIAGRARIGKNAWIGASVTISNMVEIGDDANVRIGTVAIRDVPAGKDVSGNFAAAHGKNIKRYLKENSNGP